MSILCGIGRHEAAPSDIWNDGFYFSRCRRCDCDMIRNHEGWRQVPKGYQVVWKSRTAADVDWARWKPNGPHTGRVSDFLKGSWT